jgi:uncharacterized protein YdeI (YjbR/CyaY-like superfamily)
MAEINPTENKADRQVRVDRLKQVTGERDEAREGLNLLLEAAGAGADEALPEVAHRIRAAREYVRVLRGGAN